MHLKELSFTSARVNNVLLTPPLLVTKQYNLEEGLNLNTEVKRLPFCISRPSFKDMFPSEQSNACSARLAHGGYWNLEFIRLRVTESENITLLSVTALYCP